MFSFFFLWCWMSCTWTSGFYVCCDCTNHDSCILAFPCRWTRLGPRSLICFCFLTDSCTRSMAWGIGIFKEASFTLVGEWASSFFFVSIFLYVLSFLVWFYIHMYLFIYSVLGPWSFGPQSFKSLGCWIHDSLYPFTITFTYTYYT